MKKRIRKNQNRPAEYIGDKKTLFTLWMERDSSFIAPIGNENYLLASERIFDTTEPAISWEPIVSSEWEDNLTLYSLWGVSPSSDAYYDKLEYVRRFFEMREPISLLIAENPNAWIDVHKSWEAVIYYRRFLSRDVRMVRGVCCKLFDSGIDYDTVYKKASFVCETLTETELHILVRACQKFSSLFGSGVMNAEYREMLEKRRVGHGGHMYDLFYDT